MSPAPKISVQKSQHGTALLVMMLIVVVGIATILLTTFNSSALHLSRQQQTAVALALAKEALIGRAVSDASLPGSLPCPDNNDDGSADLLSGNDCTNYLGRLPWKTLGLTDVRDGDGEHLWYALSRNFRDDNSNHINSDTSGTLNISGAQPASNVIAIVFAAGNALPNQNRSATQTALCAATNSSIVASWCANNYLENSNANLSKATALNPNYFSAEATNNFNDQLIFITHDELLPPLEHRLAREAKHCLDDYAIKSGGSYPWATPLTSISTRPAVNATYFGRFPDNTYLNIATGLPVSDANFSGCALQNSSYWNDWADMLFYQIAQDFVTGGSKNCASQTSCLSAQYNGNAMRGSGSYRAIVIVASKKLSLSRVPSNAADYLEAANLLPQNNPALPYLTYRHGDFNYLSNNDFLACVDGKVSCP
jgi:hypothetical protein